MNCQCIMNCVHKISEKLLPLWDVWARLFIANIFWKSGLTKIDDWGATLWLFKHEYKMGFISDLAAYGGTGLELLGPIFLVLGLGTRFAALGLFILSITVELTYHSSDTHYFWMLITGILFLRGADRLSLDYWIGKKYPCAFSEKS